MARRYEADAVTTASPTSPSPTSPIFLTTWAPTSPAPSPSPTAAQCIGVAEIKLDEGQTSTAISDGPSDYVADTHCEWHISSEPAWWPIEFALTALRTEYEYDALTLYIPAMEDVGSDRWGNIIYEWRCDQGAAPHRNPIHPAPRPCSDILVIM